MKIIVMSDSHRCTELPDAVVAANPDAEVFIHLGDGGGFAPADCDAAFYCLRGNCDGPGNAERIDLELEGVKIMAVHGHRQNVKFGRGALLREAKDSGASLVLYGHTHLPDLLRTDGVTLLCPGALCECGRSYAQVVLKDGQAEIGFCGLDNPRV